MRGAIACLDSTIEEVSTSAKQCNEMVAYVKHLDKARQKAELGAQHNLLQLSAKTRNRNLDRQIQGLPIIFW